jgi:hypothetical protein
MGRQVRAAAHTGKKDNVPPSGASGSFAPHRTNGLNFFELAVVHRRVDIRQHVGQFSSTRL